MIFKEGKFENCHDMSTRITIMWGTIKQGLDPKLVKSLSLVTSVRHESQTRGEQIDFSRTYLYTDIFRVFTLNKYYEVNVSHKGRLYSPKWMNFRKTSKRPLTPPPAPSFRKTMLRFFREVLKLQRNFSDWSDPPPFSENSSFLPPFFRKFIVFSPPN